MLEKRYRIVSDFGYGDKSWIERNLTETQVFGWFKLYYPDWDSLNYDDDEANSNIREVCSDNTRNYYYEVDNVNDVADWDWESS